MSGYPTNQELAQHWVGQGGGVTTTLQMVDSDDTLRSTQGQRQLLRLRKSRHSVYLS